MGYLKRIRDSAAALVALWQVAGIVPIAAVLILEWSPITIGLAAYFVTWLAIGLAVLFGAHRRMTRLEKEVNRLRQQVGFQGFFTNPDQNNLEDRVHELERRAGIDSLSNLLWPRYER